MFTAAEWTVDVWERRDRARRDSGLRYIGGNCVFEVLARVK